MNIDLDYIVQHIFKKQSLQQVSESELKRFVEHYPYSAVGQFLLAKKLNNDAIRFDHEQISQANLYFNNPIWLQWLLGEESTPEIAIESFHESTDHDRSKYNGVALSQYTNDDWASNEQNKSDSETELVEETESLTSKSDNQPEYIPELASQPLIDTGVDEEGTTDPVTNAGIHKESTSSDARHEFTEEQALQYNTQTQLAEQNSPDNTQERPEQTLPDNAQTQPGEQLTFQSAKTEQTEELTFQAYHTIDYFASQGIKLKQEDLTKDKLGQQLKSFTEWLRSMKRLHTSEQVSSTSTQDEEAAQRAIQRIAEHSLKEKEVVTEAMAEVWAKQGNVEKAREIYEKLSLLNPSKSAYFAAKIEQLKVS